MSFYSQVAIRCNANAMCLMDEETETSFRNTFANQMYFNNHEFTVFCDNSIVWDLADEDIKTIQSFIDRIIDMGEDADEQVEVLIITPNGEQDDVEHYSSPSCGYDEDKLEQVSHIQCNGMILC